MVNKSLFFKNYRFFKSDHLKKSIKTVANRFYKNDRYLFSKSSKRLKTETNSYRLTIVSKND